MSLAQRIRDELLPRVQQPAQYIGGEHNQLVRAGDWERADVRVAVAFPDTYTIGMSHLGCQILYWLCNHTPGVCAERVYCPWVDAEAILRERGIPLFTWDTRQPAASADIFAVSLQYELCFTSVLNLLDLAGIPLRAADRTDAHPLVIAGGPQGDNPEPMAPFLDLVVLGDGEQSMAAILAAYRELKAAGVPRRQMIVRLARQFPWIYAPNLYAAEYHTEGVLAGTLAALRPLESGLPTRIERCQTPDFETCAFPMRPLVPWVEVVHDRIAIEIMRGCPQVCRFCHAGYTKRPLRYRSVERILEIAEEAYAATGQTELGLLSLSTADYPLLPELATRLNERFGPRKVNLSFPSLRVDKMLEHIPWMGNSVRKGGITMAVEAARDDMRAAIRKKVTDGKLLDGVREVYKAGWNRVKLYFMAGFPGERPEDIFAIWELANLVSLERQKLGKPPADVTASVSWLVPKAYTPLQWMAQPRVEYFQRVQAQLRELGWSRGARFSSRQGGYGSAAAMMGENDWGGQQAGHEGTDTQRHGGTEAQRHEGEPSPSGSAGPVGAPNASEGRSATPAEARRVPLPDPLAGIPEPDPAYSHGRWNNRRSRVRIQMHDPERSILEAVFARGDRRLAPVIEAAFRAGARLDGWDECFRQDIWQAAFEQCGVDPAFYAHRERGFDELLPWGHIGQKMSRGYLEDAYDDMFSKIGEAKPAAGVSAAVAVELGEGFDG